MPIDPAGHVAGLDDLVVDLDAAVLIGIAKPMP